MGGEIPHGKHKGKFLHTLPDETVHAIWAAWNGTPKLKRTQFFQKIVEEKRRRESNRGTACTATASTVKVSFKAVAKNEIVKFLFESSNLTLDQIKRLPFSEDDKSEFEFLLGCFLT